MNETSRAIAPGQPIDPNLPITFAVHLRENPNVASYLKQLASVPVNQRVFLTDDNFDPSKTSGANYYGADPADVATVRQWVDATNKTIADPAKHLSVSEVAYDVHAVKISGPAGVAGKLLKLDLRQWKQDDASLMNTGHNSDATVPAALTRVARGVVGFNTLGAFNPSYRRPDNWVDGDAPRPEGWAPGQPEHHGLPRMLRPIGNLAVRCVAAAQKIAGATPRLPGHPLYPDELASFYGVSLHGQKQVAAPRIAILEYGGRTSQPNLDALARQRLQPSLLKFIPRIERHYVGNIQPNFDINANVECDLDAQVISVGLASGGIAHDLLEVNALDTEMAAGDAVAYAARDKGHPLGGAGADVASESWGDPKRNWTPQAIQYRRSAAKFAALKGVPVFVATGDNGSRDNTPAITADYYSGDDLHVAVGGTYIWIDSAGIKHDLAWGGLQMSGAGGGAVDDTQGPAYYQSGAGITPVNAVSGKTGRGTPDISADAAPESGAIITTGDDSTGAGASNQPVGGTSQATPQVASYAALVTALSGRRIGPMHGVLYGAWLNDQKLSPSQRVLRDVVQGTNGDYHAGPGWDATTGLGTPADAGLLARTLLTVQPVIPKLAFTRDVNPASSSPGLAA